MAWDVSFDPVDAEEAIAWFADRLILTRDQIDALRSDLARRAFYVSGVAQLDVVTHVWEAIDDALKQGTTLDDFRASVSSSLESAWQGTVENPGSRIETIFRTNVQSAYTAGRHAEATDPDTLADRPFWMFDAILDDATTEVCEKCDGTVRAADDAWWNTHLPPLHFQCRSHFITLTKDQAHEKGITKKPTKTEPDAGFGAPPRERDWEPEKADYPEPLWKQFEEKKLTPAQTWATDAHDALKGMKKDGGAAARTLMRERVGTLGLKSYDREWKLPGSEKIVVERDAGLADLQRLGKAHAVHLWDGTVVLTNDVADGARKALQDFADRPDLRPQTSDLQGLTTLLHEEIHGCSPLLYTGYRGAGIAIEEAGTEILARRATRELLKDKDVFDLPTVGEKRKDGFFEMSGGDDRTMYNPFIKGVLHAVAEVTKQKDVGVLVEDVFIEIRKAPGARFATAEDQIDAFVESRTLGLDVPQQSQLRRLLKDSALMTAYPY